MERFLLRTRVGAAQTRERYEHLRSGGLENRLIYFVRNSSVEENRKKTRQTVVKCPKKWEILCKKFRTKNCVGYFCKPGNIPGWHGIKGQALLFFYSSNSTCNSNIESNMARKLASQIRNKRIF
jgi:hypothetical protein